MTHLSALAFAGDENVAIGLAVAMHSTLATMSGAARPDVYVLDGGLSEHSRDKLQRVTTQIRPDLGLTWVPISTEQFGGLPLLQGITSPTYARLLIPELLRGSTARVLYLDSDVLVRSDVFPLLTIELGGAAIGAVRDFLERPIRYFNAGMMVMDLAECRKKDLGPRALERAASDPAITNDQDALNAVEQEWRELDWRWNVQHGNLFFGPLHGLTPRPDHGEFTDGLLAHRWELYREAAVLHFVGGVKPWQRLCPLPGTTAWVRTMVRTGWLSRPETTKWVLHHAISRSRYALGTTKLLALRSITGSLRSVEQEREGSGHPGAANRPKSTR